MAYIEWLPSWDTGIAELDRQHRELVAEIDRLFLALKEGSPEKVAERTLLHLSEYVEFHFKTEERCMLEAHYPGLPAHRAEHDALRNEVKAIVDAYLAGGGALTVKLSEYLKNWLIHHLDTTDRIMAEHLRRTLASLPGIPD